MSPSAALAGAPHTDFLANEILFGFDPTPAIVAVEASAPPRRKGEPSTDGERVLVWRRVDGKLTVEEDIFFPYLWMSSCDMLADGPAPLEIVDLEGGGTLRHLARFASLDALQKAKRHLAKVTGETPGSPSAPYRAIADVVQQYLMVRGRTSFKGMPFSALQRMQIFVATACADDAVTSDAARDPILAIAVATADGHETVLSGDEKAMLEQLGQLIRQHDPDVIEGHDLFRRDLAYIKARAQKLRVRLEWARDDTVLTARTTRLQIAERTIDYPRAEVRGRHLLDTWILTQFYDISHRDLEAFDLAEVASHFGLDGGDDLQSVEGPAASQMDAARLEQTMRRAVRLVRALSDLFTPIYFLQAQMFPYNFQNVLVRGNATRIDALFMREYLRRGRALPAMTAEAVPFEGGYADMFETGVLGPVLAVDVQSLYPSLMLTHGLKPRGDELDIFLGLLSDLRAFRVQAKAQAKAASDERGYFDALQSTFKILINSFYGYLGTSFCHFADHGAAADVTRHGRDLIRGIIDWLRAHGCRPIELDTDGVYFIAAPGQSEDALLQGLSSTMPAGIQLELGGRYPAMLSHKVKNYALLDEDDRLTIKGSGLKSRGMEKYLRDFLESMIGMILRGRAADVPALLEARLQAIARHELDISEICKTETLSESPDSYRQKIAAKKRNAAAAYELACASGRRYKAGDKVSYYVAGSDPARKVKVYEAARMATSWSREASDENVEYYQQKLRELVKKFEEYL